MRAALLRPLLLMVVFSGCAVTALSQSVRTETGVAPPPGKGVNLAAFAPGSPTPTVGGVDVSVVLKPTANYNCNSVEIVAIDNNTGMTLGTRIVLNPGSPTNVSFTGLPSNLDVQITVTATFQGGADFDVKFFDAVVKTN